MSTTYSQYKSHKENQTTYGNTTNANRGGTPIKKKYTPVRQRPYIDMTPPQTRKPQQQETPTTPQEAHQSTLPQSPLMSPSRRMLDRARVGHRSQAQTQQQQQARIAQQNETNQKMESAYRINTLRSLR